MKRILTFMLFLAGTVALAQNDPGNFQNPPKAARPYV